MYHFKLWKCGYRLHDARVLLDIFASSTMPTIGCHAENDLLRTSPQVLTYSVRHWWSIHIKFYWQRKHVLHSSHYLYHKLYYFD